MPCCPLCENKDISIQVSPEYPHNEFADVTLVRINLLCRDKKCGWSYDMVAAKQLNKEKTKSAI